MNTNNWTLKAVALAMVASAGSAYGQVTNRTDTEFLNQGSIAFTRHNLTQRQPGQPANTPNGSLMDPFRNNYGEVCVYCHTPHGSNASVQLPLWNRTIKAGTTYQTYNELGTVTLTQTVSRPGANSLSCLSCHDGTTAVDSIINMPGSGGYSAAMESTDDDGVINAFLSTWAPGQGDTFEHMKLNESTGAGSCLSCHSPDGIAAAQDFSVFAIGTDLRNDHPVGVTFPTANPDFATTNATTSRGDAFFDGDGDNRMDSDEVRLYNTGDGPEVECASCHDPHGVPSGGSDSTTPFNPTFLRVTNAGSSLCMTCHIK